MKGPSGLCCKPVLVCSGPVYILVMDIPLKRIATSLLSTVLTAVSFQASADYDTLFLDLAQGDAITNARIGIGETPRGEEGEKVTSMFYLGYYQSDDLVKFEDSNIPTSSHEVEIMTLGAGGFGYLENPNKNGGAEFDFELSKTTVDSLDYDRTGIGFRTQLFIPMVAGFQTNIGFNLRPFFLSPDWDDQAQLEYEYQAGFEYAFNWDIALYSHYRTVGLYDNDDNKVTLAEDLIFGLRARF